MAMAGTQIKFHEDSAKMRFIPVSRNELIKGLLAIRPELDGVERKDFQRFTDLMQAVYHSRYFERYEALKKYYQPFNPDQDVTTLDGFSSEDKSCYQQQLFRDVRSLLKRANYDELNEKLINEALSSEMSYDLKVDVEMEDFEEVLVFVRGHGVVSRKRRNWKTLFLLAHEEKVDIYRRLCIVFRFRDEESLKACLRARGMGRFNVWRHVMHHRRVMETEASQQYIFMRLFRDVPRSDLEMLFPNSKLHFTLFDKLKLGVTGGAGAVGGVWALITKLAIAVKPFAILMALAGFGSIISRNISNVIHHQNNYKMVLSRSLYTHSLDINIGVISALTDQARDEDLKESLLAYFFLLRSGKKGMTMQQLDHEIEKHLLYRYGIFMDFEVDDAVIKLKIENLISEDSGNVLHAVEFAEATKILCEQWENIFSVARRMVLLDQV